MIFPRIATRIQPYFGHRSARRLVLTARATQTPKPAYEAGSRWKAMRTMMAQFASHEVPGVPVELEAKRPDSSTIRARGITDKEGFVRFDIALDPAWELPERPAWDSVTLAWSNRDGPQTITAHVLAPGKESRLGIISDIDDTIIETGITGNPRKIARNWKRVFAQLPHERVEVPGASSFFSHIGGVYPGDLEDGQLPAAEHPFFYVSSSPWNLFSYLVAFQQLRKLPLGPIQLRDWGFNSSTLGSSSHGSHKLDAMEAIIAMHPKMRFALIGDDTQGDLPAFAQAVADFPGRIAAVFLRNAAGEPFSAEEEEAKATIEAAGVPLWMGDTYADGADFLHGLGLHDYDDAAPLVHLVDESAKAGTSEAESGPAA
ncbi:MAG: phosphatase domain-containing protein [Alteraurantiacibacter sp.]